MIAVTSTGIIGASVEKLLALFPFPKLDTDIDNSNTRRSNTAARTTATTITATTRTTATRTPTTVTTTLVRPVWITFQ